MAAESTAVEELFVLRVNDHVLADTLRAVLREDYKPEAPIELAFTDSGGYLPTRKL